MSKRLSPAATVALKEALCAVYWYKADLRSFLNSCLTDTSILSTLDWTSYKRQIVSDVIDHLIADQEHHLAELTRLCHELGSMESFRHLEQLDGGVQKASRARNAVSDLKNLLVPHKVVQKELDEIKERQKLANAKLHASAAVRASLRDIADRYMALVVSMDAQARGYALEKIMYDLFELFDLDPKASFRNTGEQIDGAFSLEGTDYLFEARWKKELTAASALDGFAAKVRRKLENTLGVFLSIEGYSEEGVAAHSTGGAVIILLDGADLMAVLEERIDFVSLLLRKKRHAAQTGNIYLRIHEIIG